MRRRLPWLRGWPALAVLATAAAMGVPSAAAAQSPGFYAPPSPLPAGRPGDLIRAEPMEAYELGGLRRLPADAWRILYHSTSATGRPIAVSGTVLVPERQRPGRLPLIGYSVGTRGIADRCAPSRQLAVGGEPEGDTIASMLDHGWAVALTDWQGLGTPGDHTYVVGKAEGRAVLDAIRAARRLAPAGIGARSPLALLGYSQGGHSTAWAAQQQPRYAPKLRLAGAAAGAVPSDLQRVADNVDGGYAAGLVIYAAIGMNAAYPGLDLERYLTASGREAVARMRNSCVFDGTLLQLSFRRSREFTTTDVPDLPDWRRRLDQNGVGAFAPKTPVLLYHARADELIPYRLSEALRDRWCRRGVNVRLRAIAGLDHSVTGSGAGNPQAVDWLADRFASGPPAPPPACAAARRG